MVTVVLRPQDWLQNPLAADAFRPPSPPRCRRYRTGHRRRQTMLPAGTADSPGSRVAPSPTKPLPRRGCPGPIRDRRSCRPPEHHRRMAVKRPVRELIMEGGETVLRRGQAAADEEDRQPVVPEWSAGDLDLCSTRRLGPDPAKLPKRTRLMDQKPDIYAGSGFFTSPPPSSLPLPTSFLAKMEDTADAADLATTALRCLLRLDLP